MKARRGRPLVRGLIVFLLALLVRLFYLFATRYNPFFDAPIIDAQTYHELAMRIANGQVSDGQPFWQPPLYPYLLGLLYAIAGVNVLGAKLAQMMLGAFNCVLASQLAQRYGGTGAAWVCGFLLALYGPLIFFDGELLTPVLTIGLDLGALLILSPPAGIVLTPRRWGLAGLMLGFSAAARPTVLLFAAGLVFWSLFASRMSRTVRSQSSPSPGHSRTALLPFMLCLLLPILPVTLHNGLIGQEWIPISSNGGINFFLGHHPDLQTGLDVRPGIAWKALMQEPEERGILSAGQASSYWFQRAIDDMLSQPFEVLALEARKLWLLVQSHEQPRNLDFQFFSRHFAPFLEWLPGFWLLFPMSVLGLWFKRKHSDQYLLYLYLVSQLLSMLAFFVVARYRLSVVPLLGLYAGCAVAGLTTCYVQRNVRELITSIGALLLISGLIQSDPWNTTQVDEAEGFNLIGKAHSSRERHTEAVLAFQQSLKLNEALVDARFNLAREYQLIGRCDLALEHYPQVRAAFPRDRDALNNEALCLLDRGKKAEGLSLLQALLALHPRDPDIHFNLAQAYYNLGYLEAAIRTQSQALRLAPKTPYLAATLQRWKFEQQAQARLSALIRAALDEETSRTRERASPSGLSLSAQEADGSQAGKTVPPEVIALNNEGHRLIRAQRPLEACTHLLDALSKEPRYAIAWSNLGQAYFLLDKLENASRAFAVALKLDPNYWNAQLGLALVNAQSVEGIPRARLELERVAHQAPEPLAARARALLLDLQTKSTPLP